MMANPLATYLDEGKLQSTIVPFDLYDAKDGRIAVAVATDQQFATLCDIIETPDLKQFATNDQRAQHRAQVEERLTSALKTKPVEEWITLFKAHDISAQPVLSLPDALQKYGRQVVKVSMGEKTADGKTSGDIYVGNAATSNIFPHHPHIGSAPKHGADKSSIIELLHHLQEQQNNPLALDHALEVASDTPDKAFQRNYAFVDIREMDLTKPRCDLPWAQGNFFLMRKVGKVTAVPADPNEIVDIRHGRFMHKSPAMKGDWKITTSFGDQYLLPDEKFKKLYVPAEEGQGVYQPNPELPARKAIKVTENIRFVSPWRETTYIPKGGWVALGSDGPYGIHPNNIAGKQYAITEWAHKIQPGASKRTIS